MRIQRINIAWIKAYFCIAGQCNEQGHTLFDISKMLGHSRTDTTGRIYTHLFDTANEAMITSISTSIKDGLSKGLHNAALVSDLIAQMDQNIFEQEQNIKEQKKQIQTKKAEIEEYKREIEQVTAKNKKNKVRNKKPGLQQVQAILPRAAFFSAVWNKQSPCNH